MLLESLVSGKKRIWILILSSQTDQSYFKYKVNSTDIGRRHLEPKYKLEKVSSGPIYSDGYSKVNKTETINKDLSFLGLFVAEGYEI